MVHYQKTNRRYQFAQLKYEQKTNVLFYKKPPLRERMMHIHKREYCHHLVVPLKERKGFLFNTTQLWQPGLEQEQSGSFSYGRASPLGQSIHTLIEKKIGYFSGECTDN